MADPVDFLGLGLQRADETATPGGLGLAATSPELRRGPDPFGPDPLSDYSTPQKIATGIADWAATSRGQTRPSEIVIRERQLHELKLAQETQKEFDQKLALLQRLPPEQRPKFTDEFAHEFEVRRPGSGKLFLEISKNAQVNSIGYDEAVKLDPEVAAADVKGGMEAGLEVIKRPEVQKRLAWWGNEKMLGPTIERGHAGISWLQQNEPDALAAAMKDDLTFAEFEALNNKLPEGLKLDYRMMAVAESEPRFYEAFDMTPPGYVLEKKKALDKEMLEERFRVKGTVLAINQKTGEKKMFIDRDFEAVTRKEPGVWLDAQDAATMDASANPKEKTQAATVISGNLRNEFKDTSKKFVTIRDSYRGIEEAGKGNTPADNMALVFSFMTLLDPTSSVKEGEYATAENARGVPEYARNYWNKLLKGDILTPKQRQDMVATAKKRFATASKGQRELEREYERLAKAHDVPADQVIIDYFGDATAEDEPAAAAAEIPEGLPAGSTPVGDGRWTLPNGKIVKPKVQ